MHILHRWPQLVARHPAVAQRAWLHQSAFSPHECPYALLGVQPQCTATQLKAAFRQKALALHPDLNTGTVSDNTAFLKVVTAYELLADVEKRAAYDRERQKGSATGARGTSFAAPGGDAAVGQQGSAPAPARRTSAQTDAVVRQAGDDWHDVTEDELQSWRYGVGSWLSTVRSSAPPQVHGEGTERLASRVREALHRYQGYLGHALTRAYLGPRINVSANTPLPRYFEAEQRTSRDSTHELFHIVSGRTVLGVVSTEPPPPRPAGAHSRPVLPHDRHGAALTAHLASPEQQVSAMMPSQAGYELQPQPHAGPEAQPQPQSQAQAQTHADAAPRAAWSRTMGTPQQAPTTRSVSATGDTRAMATVTVTNEVVSGLTGPVQAGADLALLGPDDAAVLGQSAPETHARLRRRMKAGQFLLPGEIQWLARYNEEQASYAWSTRLHTAPQEAGGDTRSGACIGGGTRRTASHTPAPSSHTPTHPPHTSTPSCHSSTQPSHTSGPSASHTSPPWPVADGAAAGGGPGATGNIEQAAPEVELAHMPARAVEQVSASFVGSGAAVRGAMAQGDAGSTDQATRGGRRQCAPSAGNPHRAPYTWARQQVGSEAAGAAVSDPVQGPDTQAAQVHSTDSAQAGAAGARGEARGSTGESHREAAGSVGSETTVRGEWDTAGSWGDRVAASRGSGAGESGASETAGSGFSWTESGALAEYRQPVPPSQWPFDASTPGAHAVYLTHIANPDHVLWAVQEPDTPYTPTQGPSQPHTDTHQPHTAHGQRHTNPTNSHGATQTSHDSNPSPCSQAGLASHVGNPSRQGHGLTVEADGCLLTMASESDAGVRPVQPKGRVKIYRGGEVVLGVDGDFIYSGQTGAVVARVMRGGSPGVHCVHIFDYRRSRIRLLCRMYRGQALPTSTWLFPPRSEEHSESSWWFECNAHGEDTLFEPGVYILLAALASKRFEQVTSMSNIRLLEASSATQNKYVLSLLKLVKGRMNRLLYRLGMWV